MSKVMPSEARKHWQDLKSRNPRLEKARLIKTDLGPLLDKITAKANDIDKHKNALRNACAETLTLLQQTKAAAKTNWNALQAMKDRTDAVRAAMKFLDEQLPKALDDYKGTEIDKIKL